MVPHLPLPHPPPALYFERRELPALVLQLLVPARLLLQMQRHAALLDTPPALDAQRRRLLAHPLLLGHAPRVALHVQRHAALFDTPPALDAQRRALFLGGPHALPLLAAPKLDDAELGAHPRLELQRVPLELFLPDVAEHAAAVVAVARRGVGGSGGVRGGGAAAGFAAAAAALVGGDVGGGAGGGGGGVVVVAMAATLRVEDFIELGEEVIELAVQVPLVGRQVDGKERGGGLGAEHGMQGARPEDQARYEMATPRIT